MYVFIELNIVITKNVVKRKKMKNIAAPIKNFSKRQIFRGNSPIKWVAR
jgi:hypothetical protein